MGNARMRHVRKIAALLAIGLAPACSGTPNTPNGPYVGSPGNPGGPPAKLVDVKVSVTIPAASKGARSDYLSTNTQSLAIQLASVDGKGISGVNPTILNTLPKSHDCKAQAQGLLCSAMAKGSPGSDTFAVTTYDNIDATGAVLSVGTVQAKISGNGGGVGISNRLPLSLEGVIASLKLTLSPKNAKRGVRTTATLTLNAYDASGAQIVGPSDYVESIALVIQGDTDKSFLLHDGNRSGQSLTIVKPTGDLTLTYDGNKQASPISVVATVSGPSGASKSAGFNLTGKQPPPPFGTIYVLNYGSKSGQGATITEYDGNAKGNAAPERTIALDSTLYAVSLAVDASGSIYVGYFDSNLGETDGKPDSGNEIAIYSPDASGSGPPEATIKSLPSGSSATTLYPIFIAFDPLGRLVTYGASLVDKNSGNAVLTYAAGASGSPAPEYAFAFSQLSIDYPGPSGLTIDAKNNFYLNGTFKAGFTSEPGVYVNLAANIGNDQSSPNREIPWKASTGLLPGQTSNVGLDTSGEIYVGNFDKSGSGSSTICQAAVNVYTAGTGSGSKGDSPVRVLTLDGIKTQGTDCTNTFSPLLFYYPQITLYGSDLFAADPFGDAIDAYGSDGDHTVKPFLQIAGSATQLNAPIAIVVTRGS
jgi:hypothetical protein